MIDCLLKRLLGRRIVCSTRANFNFTEKRIVHAVFSLGCGGAERQLVNTISRINGTGTYEHCVLARNLKTEKERHYKDAVERSGVKVFEVSSLPTGSSDEIFKKASLLPGFMENNLRVYCEAFYGLNPQIVHVWSDNIYAVIAALMLGVPKVILSWQSISPKEFASCQKFSLRRFLVLKLWKALLTSTFSRPEMIYTANSEAGRRSYSRWLGLPEERIHLLYNGIDNNFVKGADADSVALERRSLGIGPDEQVVMGLMRMQDIKRPDLWISVAEKLKERANTKFVLYGDGPLYAKMKPRSDKAGAIMPGLTSNPASCLGFADVFLHTAKVEGLPNVLLEAQLMGVPVVATQAGGSAEAILNGKTGFVLEDGKNLAERLAGAVLEILENNEWRREAGDLAPVFVQDKFSIEAMLANTVKLYG